MCCTKQYHFTCGNTDRRRLCPCDNKLKKPWASCEVSDLPADKSDSVCQECLDKWFDKHKVKRELGKNAKTYGVVLLKDERDTQHESPLQRRSSFESIPETTALPTLRRVTMACESNSSSSFENIPITPPRSIQQREDLNIPSTTFEEILLKIQRNFAPAIAVAHITEELQKKEEERRLTEVLEATDRQVSMSSKYDGHEWEPSYEPSGADCFGATLISERKTMWRAPVETTTEIMKTQGTTDDVQSEEAELFPPFDENYFGERPCKRRKHTSRDRDGNAYDFLRNTVTAG